MENLRTIIVLFAVVIAAMILFVIFRSRLNLKGNLSPIFGGKNANIRVTSAPTPSLIPTPSTNTLSAQKQPGPTKKPVFINTPSGIKSIPSTGAPLFLIPAALSSLLGGLYLRRKSR